MNKRLLAVVLTSASLLAATPAFAQVASDTDTADVTIDGSVAPLCILGEPSPAAVNLNQMVETSGVRVGRIRAIGVQNVSLPNSFCNFAGSVVSVTAEALVSDSVAATQPGFARAVNYTATASGWTASDASTTTSAAADGSNPSSSDTGATQPLPKLATIDVQLSGFTVPSDLLLLSDTYSGLVTVTLGPAAIAE
jgi:hypothetical protein